MAVFSVRKESISPGEKWRVTDIYQIVVSGNGFASLDQRQPFPHIIANPVGTVPETLSGCFYTGL